MNPSDPEYHNDGGRGITVAPEWLNSFEAYMNDMGGRPSAKHSVDRIDVNGPYSPANTRWATIKEQNRNRRDTLFVVYRGKRRPVIDVCEELGLPYGRVVSRIVKGWSPEEAITLPKGVHRKPKATKEVQPRKCKFVVIFRDRKQSLQAWCNELGVKYATARWRYLQGKPLDEVFAPRRD